MMWWWIIKGGPIMIPIVLGSVLGLTLVTERALAFIRVSHPKSQKDIEDILGQVRQGRIPEALSMARATSQPAAAVLQAGLEQWNMPLEWVKESMEEANQEQVRHLEQGLGGLATVITVEPMLGFLGTITGLIRAFMAWEAAGAQVTVSVLAGGIYEAMITTAAGLIIAIPFLMAYNTFVSRIKQIAAQSAQAGHQLATLYVRQQLKELSYEAAVHTSLPSES